MNSGETKITRTHPPLSVPAPGRTIFSCVEQRAVPIRTAIEITSRALNGRVSLDEYRKSYDSRFSPVSVQRSSEEIAERVAKNLVNQWLLAGLSGDLSSGGSLSDAEAWFLGLHSRGHTVFSTKLARDAELLALRELSSVKLDHDFLDLLPYILEPHGPGSRLTAMKDPSTKAAWRAKRETGVFYTPADVTEYMVGRLYQESGHKVGGASFFDPCCGSGAFLVAGLLYAKRAEGATFDALEQISKHFFGVDISEAAIEACAFTLLAHSMSSVKSRGITPWAAWHLIRMNLAPVDALGLTTKNAPASILDELKEKRMAVQRTLFSDGAFRVEAFKAPVQKPVSLDLFSTEGRPQYSLGELFPGFDSGFDLLAANPPYADLGQREDFDELSTRFESLPEGSSTANLFPLFIEMMWRFTKDSLSAATVVVPLSIAYHQGKQYRACRKALSRHGGNLDFAFFDREPHALFGEDVKTRNCILFRMAGKNVDRDLPANIRSGGLQRWTSRTRDTLFKNTRFFPLGRIEISQFVPKIGSLEETVAYSNIERSRQAEARAPTLWCSSGRATLAQTVALPEKSLDLFVASTAYNFINVFRSLDYSDDRSLLSTNPVYRLSFRSSEERDAAFAILSSRITYWLWQVECDGFHVTQKFLERLPFTLPGKEISALAKLGSMLWGAVKSSPILSINSGKRTLAYPATSFASVLDQIDEIILKTMGIDPGFSKTLKEFIRKIVVVDDGDVRREKQKKRMADINIHERVAQL